jgi:hypothetical protein
MTNWFLRLVAVAVAGLGLIATTGVTATTPALADDGSTRPTRFVLKGDPYKHVGAKRAAELKAAQSINEHATGPKRKVLDYKLADKYDKGHKTVRRQFAASWLWTGRTIKHISKKERKVVKSYVKKYFGKAKAPSGLAATARDASVRCTGRGGFQSLGGGEWNGYFNSCSTAIMIAELRYGGILVGLIATKMGPYSPAGVAAAVLMEAGAEWIDLLRGLSSSNAVFVIRRLIGPATASQQVFTMLPQ